VLLLGALEWLRTAAMLVQQRLALGTPWLRLAIILGVVALLTAAAALVFRSARLRRRYGGPSVRASDRSR
jgi:predicted transcriptional regulator